MAHREHVQPIDPSASMTTGAPVPAEGKTVHPGDSAVQRAAEPLMVAAVAETIGVTLAKKRLSLAEGVQCEVDGASADGRVLVEAFAHQGAMRGAQLKKVSEDVLKLVTLARGRTGMRLIVAFADELAAKDFLGRSWKAEALRIWGVEVLVVELHGDIRAGIRDAQVRQFR